MGPPPRPGISPSAARASHGLVNGQGAVRSAPGAPLKGSPPGGAWGRVNGSPGRTNGGRVNGSPGRTNGGRVNGSRVNGGRTNGALVRPAARRPGPPRRRAAATSALALLLLATLGAVLVPASAENFVVDGHFGEWAGVPSFPGALQATADGPAAPTAVKVSDHLQTLFVHASFDRPLFDGAHPEVLRIFVDSDADRATGFDMGSVGADLMLEASGSGGKLSTSSVFEFDPVRGADDWNGWRDAGRAPFAFSGAGFEAQVIPVADPGHALVLVTTSDARGDAVPPTPAVAGGAVVATALPQAGEVTAHFLPGTALYSLELAALGSDQDVASLALAPVGGADLSAVASMSLRTADGAREVVAQVVGGQAQFTFDPELSLRAGSSLTAAVDVRFKEGFGGHAGESFGLSIASAEGPNRLLSKEAAPATYLGFVSPLPVVDGAFGEWALAAAQPEDADRSIAAGLDLVGTRAMWQGDTGAFFAETRGGALAGSWLSDLPARARSIEPPAQPALGQPAAPAAGAAPPPLPPLSANDRLLVYIDSDRDPTTGYRPVPDFPVGAEFVVQVGGRFSRVTDGQLLAYGGQGPAGSAWIPRGNVEAVAHGTALEGAIPAEAVLASMGARLLFQTVDGGSLAADVSATLQEFDADGIDTDGLLHFRMVTFDPLKGEPPIRADLRQDGPNGYWIVQFGAEAPPSAVPSVEALGATLYGYVHSNAFLAKFPPESAAAIRGVPGVRWVGVYQPAFKFGSDPSNWPPGPVRVDALLFERGSAFESMVGAAGGTLIVASARGARVEIDSRRAADLAAVADIQFLELASTPAPLNDVGRRYQGVNQTFADLGLNGSGIVVGISDTGLDFTHPAFDDTGTSSPNFDGRVVGYFRYGSAYGDLDGHGTHTAGSVAGDGDLSNTSNATGILSYQYRGVAPAAALVVTASLAGSPPIDDQVFADQQVFGATVSSNSWGYVDGQQNPITDYDAGAYLTDLSVVDANGSRAGLQPLTIVFAAGNAGAGANTVGSPGTAKNVITVGASESDRNYNAYADDPNSTASFSSRGPTDDARSKPDVVAVGTYVLSAQSRTASCSCTYGGWDLSWTGPNYAFSSGTSQATPQVSGMVALIQQHINQTYARIPSPALVKAALINGAEDLGMGYEYTGGVTGVMSQGWGRVNVSRSIEGPPGGVILYEEEGTTLSTGDVSVHRYHVASSTAPLKVTLVWSDAPGNPGDTMTLPELVNDLDLVVRAPNGTYYHGNQFAGAWSRANNSSFDRRNNVENVFVRVPGTGTWTVEVTGALVKAGRQSFALALSADVEEVGLPAVTGDSTFPGAPAGAKFGWNVTVASINGDAYSDIVVGAPGANGGNGSVYVFFGAADADAGGLNVSMAGAVLSGGSGESFGWAVDASGDWDNDGVSDLLVGAPGSGKAYLYLGGSSWSSRTTDITFTGSSADRFGESVLLAGGLDTSAGAEAVVGAPRNGSSAGRAFIFSGGSTSGSLTTGNAGASPAGGNTGALFGSALASGDFDGDGDGDLAVGSPGASAVRVFMGGVALAAWGASFNFTGLPDTRFGHSVSLEGSLNGDAFDDLVVGAPLANASVGASYVFFGRTTPLDDQVYRVYFYDNMESGASKWSEMVGSSTTGSPWGVTASTFYGDEATGHAWEDSLGNYNASVDVSVRFASGINLSTATNPVLSFVYLSDVEGGAFNYDGFRVEYSTNGGSSWTHLDSTNAQGQYDTLVFDGAGPPSSKSVLRGEYAFTYDRTYWRPVVFNVSSLAGSSNVIFRFRFASDSVAQEDGIYIDNVAVREQSPSSPNFTVYGASPGDRFGTSVAALPSAAGTSGLFDLAVGAPYADNGLVYQAGAAYVFQGSTTLNGTASAPSAAAVSHGASAKSGAGWSVRGIAGFNDSAGVRIFVGAPLGGNNQGGALVGSVTGAIPELSDLVPVSIMVMAIFVAMRGRRRTRPNS